MPDVSKDTRVLKDPVTGELISVPAAEADQRAKDQGLDFATLGEISKFNEREKYGSAGQTALGALELAGESATLGLYQPKGADAEARRRVLRRDSPVTAFAAESAAILPGVAAAAATGGAAGAVGLSARAAGAASMLAEGGVSGFAQEQVQAREEGRDIDVGNILMYGVGGEIAGRIIPKALGAGLRKAVGTGEDVLSGGADNVLVRAEQRAGQSGSDVAQAAPGPERDRFLRDNARDIVNDASERARQALDRGAQKFSDLGDISKKRSKIANLVSKEHPGQDRWIAEQLDNIEQARMNINGLADAPGLKGMAKKLSDYLDDAEARLTSPRKAADRFIEADGVKRGLQKYHVSLGRSKMNAQDAVYHEQMMSIVDGLQEGVRRGLEDESLWGRAARFQADVNSAWSNRWFKGAQVTEGDLARLVGKDFDAKAITEFDPAKVRSFLEKDKVGRGLTQEKLEEVLTGYQEMAEAHRKWNMTDPKALDKLQADVAEVRKAIGEADEVQQASPRANKADQAELAQDQLIAQGLPGVGAAYVGLKRAIRNINTAGKLHTRASANIMVNGVRRVAKGLDSVAKVGAPVGAVAAGHLRERESTDSRFKGQFPTMTQSFQAKRQSIVTALQEPESLVDAIASSTGDLSEVFPDVHFRLAERMVTAMNYLGQHMPPGVENSLLGRHSTPPDVQSIRQFARLWEAVMDPGAVVQDFGTMQATPAQARAIEAVHPDIYAQLQTDALNSVADSPVRPPYERIRYLAQMFKIGAALGGVWKPGVAQNIKNAMGSAPSNPEGLPSGKLETSIDSPRGISSIASGPSSGGI